MNSFLAVDLLEDILQVTLADFDTGPCLPEPRHLV